MKKFFLSDITIGLVLTLVTIGAFFLQFDFFESLELKTYDWRSFLRQNPNPGNEIALVVIDDDSISKLGRWPWPRAMIAEGINAVNAAGAKVIGLNILFTEEEKNQGLVEIKNLKNIVSGIHTRRSDVKQILKKINGELDQAEVRLDNDTKLKDTLENAKNVILPMYFVMGPTLGSAEPILSSHTLTQIEGVQEFPLMEGHDPAVPLSIFSDRSPGIGHVNLVPDPDGIIRNEIPSMQYAGDFYPSFAVQIVRQYLGLGMEDVKLVIGQSMSIGRAVIPLDTLNRMLINFNGPLGTFPYYSFFDVINDKVDPGALKGKIVLLGLMATGVVDLNVTPIGHNIPGIDITANIIQNILHDNHITRPAWANNAELGMIAFIGLFITFLLPRLKAFLGSLLSFVFLAAIAGAGTYFFMSEGYWIKIFYPLFLLTSGYIIITSKRFFVTEKKKELVEASAIETNKMLGLSFQGQGILDMAFEKFRKCPIDDQLKDLLYNLALDFERKRQYNKAVSVYEHIQTVDHKFKGIDERVKQLKAASDGAVFGGIGGKKGGEGTVILEGAGATVPTLGRYEIVKELGHGAMGTVYLGKDPKINRQVAIKTLRFDDDVDEANMKSIKERFFREAESAGNLNHPNIIKIYDAGEDHDISYIAMELLEGEDLKKYTDKTNLLPLATLLDYMRKIAEGLDYAHKLGVIHRDIKPANIMLLKDGALRVTDFGIARIQASSKTATGTVLGTPSYMSPEQLAGKKVDGRSDLFSMGVMFYEMLLGEKPFEGDSIAALLFKISSEKHPNIKEKNPNAPDCVVAVIDKLLEKNPDTRYQNGAEVAKDIADCQAKTA
ncbi:MAG: CHASE2 domain-containing protein [Endomicrobiales bacterium]|nr:CHASE2 domain-containing protein [Endomicrobiales bacterium]